jgi:hypothetical protein
MSIGSEGKDYHYCAIGDFTHKICCAACGSESKHSTQAKIEYFTEQAF